MSEHGKPLSNPIMNDVIFTQMPERKLSVVMQNRFSCIVQLDKCHLTPGAGSRLFFVSSDPDIRVGPLEGLELDRFQAMGLKIQNLNG